MSLSLRGKNKKTLRFFVTFALTLRTLCGAKKYADLFQNGGYKLKVMKILSILLSLIALTCFAAPNAQAQSKLEIASLYAAKVEAYFKTLTTASARFVQTAPDGSRKAGIFYLSRPGKLRFQYDKPLTDFVVADGLFIYFYDGDLKQQTNAPISQTLADFILRKNLKLSGDLRVQKVAKGGGLVQVTIVQTADPASGSLTLGFTESPRFELKKWQIRDAAGSVTEIELFNLKRGVKLDSKLFRYIDPAPRKLNK